VDVTVTVSTQDIILRLLAAALAGALIGFDRGMRGRTAGLRTNILVCLAAAGAMIEANLTLGVLGKTGSSFTMMDALRFPLGILTGIGFIGAGAILRRDNIVKGVTTAATIWLVTVIGLVIGGGYFILGTALVVLAMVVLSLLIHVEHALPRDRTAMLTVETAKEGATDEDLRGAILEAGYKITLFSIEIHETRKLRWSLIWRSNDKAQDTPPLVRELMRRPEVTAIVWSPQDADEHE
jgi:putative Mg2+ transporter-C (MgtC) family protein